MYRIELFDDQMTDEYILAVKESYAKDYIALGVTQENAPTNGAFFNKGQLNRLKMKVTFLYVAMDGDKIVGGVGCAIDRESLKIKKLFVSNDYKGLGLGKQLLDHCFDIAKDKKIKKVTLGMIRENEKLYNYYLRYGFEESKTQFNVKMGLNITFMEKML